MKPIDFINKHNLDQGNFSHDHFIQDFTFDTATEEEVKTAFRKKAMMHHPDRGGDRKEFEKCVDAKNRILALMAG